MKLIIHFVKTIKFFTAFIFILVFLFSFFTSIVNIAISDVLIKGYGQDLELVLVCDNDNPVSCMANENLQVSNVIPVNQNTSQNFHVYKILYDTHLYHCVYQSIRTSYHQAYALRNLNGFYQFCLCTLIT